MKHFLSELALQNLPRVPFVWPKQRLSILIYHRVLTTFDYLRPNEPTIEEFDWQMELVTTCLEPLGLTEALERLESGTLPTRAVCVTFDDGYADNLDNALPILKKWHIPATVFVATGFLNGGRMWNDTVIEAIRSCRHDYLDLGSCNLGEYSIENNECRLAAVKLILGRVKYLPPETKAETEKYIASQGNYLPSDLMLTSNQLRTIAEHGVEIGGHTHSHPILSAIPEKQAEVEIQKNKELLESIIDKPVNLFAYPNGIPGKDYHEVHIDMVKRAGFKAALSTRRGVSAPNEDRWQLPRFTPWDKEPGRFMSRLLINSLRRH